MDYQPKGTNLDEEIKKKNETDWLAIQQAKNLYLQAQQAGDNAAMEAAHASAEAVRSKYGYSGGEDGSQRIGLAGSGYADLVKQVYQQAGQAAERRLEAEQQAAEAGIAEKSEAAGALREQGVRKAAVLREQQLRDLKNELGRLGLTGGAAETALLQVEKVYQENLRQVEQDHRAALEKLEQQLAESRREGIAARAGIYEKLASELVPDYLTAVKYDRQTGLDLAERQDNLYRQQLALAAQLAEYGDFSIYQQLGADISALEHFFAGKK